MVSRLSERLFFKYWRKYLTRYLESMNSLDGEVLDIGCGYGNYSELFGKKYMGIDKSASTIEKAKKLYPDRIFEIMDATDLKLENNKFGLILSVLTLHHIEDNEV